MAILLLMHLIAIPVGAVKPQFTLSAESSVLMDATSGKVLYAQNPDRRHLIASTTKVMTALVVLDRVENLDEKVIIAKEWAGIEGSSMYLEAGDEVSYRALLYGLLLNSGNDAATALACLVAGSEAEFAVYMNEYAERFGMTNTHFSNPHGLDADDHYSTAYDMALLMVQAMKYEDFRTISATKYVEIDGFEMYYHNKLLRKYEYCVSGKTGYTVAAGRTLVTAAEKDGQMLVVVTLRAPDHYNDHIKLYDYGFEHFPLSTLCSEGNCLASVPLEGTALSVPVYCADTIRWQLEEGDKVERIICLPEHIVGSIPKGVVIGRMVVKVNGQTAGTTLLVTGAYADKELGEVSYEWKSEFKKSYPLAGCYPDAQPKGTYRLEGLLSTAFWHNWG